MKDIYQNLVYIKVLFQQKLLIKILFLLFLDLIN